MLTKPKSGATINIAHPLSKGLVGFWLFNEGSGDLANDISGHGNHGTLKNMLPNAQGTKWQGSKFGGGLAFDGDDDYVDCGDGPSLTFTDSEPWSFEHRINWDGQADKSDVYYAGENSYVEFFAIRTSSNNRFAFRDNVGTYHHFAADSSNPCVGVWTHLVWIADGTGNLTLYINGTLLGTLSTPTGMHFDWIGLGYSGPGACSYEGTIDDVRIYNRALPAEEIKTLYYDPYCNLLKIPIYQHYVLGPPHTNLGISGTITDPSGNPIEGATIKLENRTLGENLTNETSDVNGEYAMDLANLANQWSDGDILILNAEARGFRQTVTSAADDSVPSLEVNFNNTVQRILMVM